MARELGPRGNYNKYGARRINVLTGNITMVLSVSSQRTKDDSDWLEHKK